jgi:HK97 family phage portal protein
MHLGLRTYLDNLLSSPNPVFDHRVDASPLRFRGQFDPERVPDWQQRKANWALWDSETLRADVVRKSVIVFACLTYLADAVAEATLTAEQYTSADGWQPATDRNALVLQSLLARPNPYMEDAEFDSLLIYQMGIQGYAVVEKVRSGQGLPVELWPLRPDWLAKKPDGTYTYKPDGSDTTRVILADDLIFLPWRHDDRMQRQGISPVQVAAREIGVDSALTDFLKTFLDSGGIPPFVMTYPDVILDESQIEAMQEKWRQKYGGSKAWGTLPILHGGYNIVPIGNNINEMAWPDLRGLTELKICQAFRVPAELVQAREAFVSGALTTTEADGAMTQLQRYGAAPLRSRLAAALGRGLLPEFGLDHVTYRLAFDVSGILALREDTDALHARVRANFDAGLLTMDEARLALDLPELPNAQGQVFKVPFSVVFTPAAQLTYTGEPEPVAVPEKAVRVYMDTKTLSPAQLEFRSRASARIHRDRQRLIEQGARHIGKMLKAQGVRLSESIAKSQGGMERKDIEAIDWAYEEQELAKVLNRFYMANGEAAFEATAGLTGTESTWQISNPRIAKLMQQLGLRITAINDTTRATVQQLVTDGLIEGQTYAEIAESIAQHVEQTYAGRAMTIARTESITSYGKASVLSYAESGVVEQVEFMDNPDHTEDYGASDGLSCAERDGLVVPLYEAEMHIEAEHPNGSLVVLPVLSTPLGEG